jgi:hypothetical protein
MHTVHVGGAGRKNWAKVSVIVEASLRHSFRFASTRRPLASLSLISLCRLVPLSLPTILFHAACSTFRFPRGASLRGHAADHAVLCPAGEQAVGY